MLKGLDTSAVKYVQCLVPAARSTGGSTQAVDYSNFTFGTVLATCGSTGAAAITVSVLRSATSNGTFNGIGASLNLSAASKTHVRSFTANSSAVWYKLYLTHVGGGSPIVSAYLIQQGGREAPIDQDTNTTSYSVISNA
jgi:hypothetical protein